MKGEVNGKVVTTYVSTCGAVNKFGFKVFCDDEIVDEFSLSSRSVESGEVIRIVGYSKVVGFSQVEKLVAFGICGR